VNSGANWRSDPSKKKIRKVRELIWLSHKVKHRRLRSSVKGTKATQAFVSWRKREREVQQRA